MGVIPISIAIGIIEDKIANDLSSNNCDDKTKSKIIKHLEDVKNKICKTKETEFINKHVTVNLKNNDQLVFNHDCININFNDKNFVIFEKSDGSTKRLVNRDMIIDIITKDTAAVKDVGQNAAQPLKQNAAQPLKNNLLKQNAAQPLKQSIFKNAT